MSHLRKTIFALALLLAPSFAFAANCLTGHVYTPADTGSCTVPAGVTSITFNLWGGGAAGNSDGVTWTTGGGGGGFCSITLTVTPAGTIYYIAGAGGSSSAGTNSWINISSNVQPTGSASGCYAATGIYPSTISTNPVGGGGHFGSTNHTGGAGDFGNDNSVAGGGGGAGSGGNGGNGNNGTPGVGGTPDGGAGNGGVPGGAGSGAYSGSSGGGNGQITMVFTAGPTGATPFIFIPSIIP